MARLFVLLLAGIAGSVAAAGFPVAPVVTGDVWLNSAPLTLEQQRGKVVLVEFWTFGCWNCRNVHASMVLPVAPSGSPGSRP